MFAGYKLSLAFGGSAVIIKESINHFEESHLQRADMQLTVIAIKSTKQKLTVGAIYCPPRHNLKQQDYKILLQHPKVHYRWELKRQTC